MQWHFTSICSAYRWINLYHDSKYQLAFCTKIMFMIIVLSIVGVLNSKMSLVNQVVYTEQECNGNSLLYTLHIGKISYSIFPAIKHAFYLDHSYKYISINCIRSLDRVCYIVNEFAMTFHFYLQCMQVITALIIMILGILH